MRGLVGAGPRPARAGEARGSRRRHHCRPSAGRAGRGPAPTMPRVSKDTAPARSSPPMPLSIAIVGSGPAGCYAAEKLARDAPGAAIDVIDKLPTPYGLIRCGVAPDHQGTKAVAHLFERLF